MTHMHEIVAGMPKGFGRNVCLSAFDNNQHAESGTLSCEEVFGDLINMVYHEFPLEKQALLVRRAIKACPSVDPRAAEHSTVMQSSTESESGPAGPMLNGTAPHQLVCRLKDMARVAQQNINENRSVTSLLLSDLRHLEGYLTCPLSKAYDGGPCEA